MRGITAAVVAYLIWGFAALYWVQTKPVSPIDVLAHRGFWSMPLVALVLWHMQRLQATLAMLRDAATVRIMLIAALTIAINWGVFLWAVTNGRATEASLGYFILPLVNVLIGLLFFGERLERAAQVAVALAAAGIALEIYHMGHLPWVALALALSFGIYGAIRKRISVGAIEGQFLETLFLWPVAAAWLLLHGGGGLGSHGLRVDLFLIGCGIFTALPLILHVAASRSMPLSTVGLISYIGPTAQLFVAVVLFREPFSVGRLVAFGLVWAGLAVVTAAALRKMRAPVARLS